MLNRREFLACWSFAPPSWSTEFEGEWHHYGGDAGATRFSPLAQINASNASRLKLAWTHSCGDQTQRPATTIECTPIMVHGVLYLTTAKLQVRALNPATGEALWNFNPFPKGVRSAGVNRGVTWFEDGKDKRLFAALQDKLYCLDPRSGELVKSFGDQGVVDLTANFDRDMTGLTFRITSPAVIFEDTLIVGGGGGEGPRPQAPGHIRGYDVYTGKRKWIFHTIPHPGEFGYHTWPKDAWRRSGAANNWAGMSVDLKRGWVFVPTGSASFDFWGGDRHGDNLFSDCILALDARSGKRIWHYQTVRHDVWDYDLPAQPALASVRVGGRRRDVVVQVTKTGFVFVLDRDTGKPLFPVQEWKTPASDVEDEKLSPTQPVPVRPKPLCRLEVNADLLTDISPEAHEFALEKLKTLRGGVPFAPPSLQGTIYSPGTLGGALWGGCCWDPTRERLFVNTSELPSIARLLRAKPGQDYRFSLQSYEKFVDHEGFPAVKPPWGHLTAIDLRSGEWVWREVLGEYPALVARGKTKTGSFQLGGSIVTAGGLVFIAATADEKIRALDVQSGATVWEYKLPFGGYATPCTYFARGKQFLVIACGGGNRQQTPSGGDYLAFSL
ncbi:MAG: pyrroloquinoline quinone-dependent dehydrogenase [Bryobacteraceae bacterium]|nr:pyrroloquinoline quinone-dependent dehydrogenase [Bryobacteraceae bacterium]MDW8377803.1 pyrroloquinoline quinone-dependent dehydrogenase [Bryobacterales bacterium]